MRCPFDLSMRSMSQWTIWTLSGEHQGLCPELWLQGVWCLHGRDRCGAVEGQHFGTLAELCLIWLLMGCGLASSKGCFCGSHCYTRHACFWILFGFSSPFLYLCPVFLHKLACTWCEMSIHLPGGPQDRVGPSGPLGTSRIFPGIQRAFGAKAVPWRLTLCRFPDQHRQFFLSLSFVTTFY